MVCSFSNRKAFFVADARLLDIDVDAFDSSHNASGFVHQPAGVRIGDQLVTRSEHTGDGVNPSDVFVGIATDFQLESSVAFFAIAVDILCHFFRRLLRDRSVKHEVISPSTTEQCADGNSGNLPEDIPAGDIDSGLHIRMPLHGGIHELVQLAELRRVMPNQMWSQFGDSSSNSGSVSWQVERPEWTNFAMTDHTFVGFDSYDRAVKHVDRFSTRPFIATFVQRKFDSVSSNSRNLHGSATSCGDFDECLQTTSAEAAFCRLEKSARSR